jgi:hypothetical protein
MFVWNIWCAYCKALPGRLAKASVKGQKEEMKRREGKMK